MRVINNLMLILISSSSFIYEQIFLETSKAQMTNHWLQVGKMKSLILPQKNLKEI